MLDIKEELQSLITEDSSKETIEKIAVISNKIDEMMEQSAKQEVDYKDLLADYAKVIKQSVYKVDNHTMVDEGKKNFSFDSFLKEWQEKNN